MIEHNRSINSFVMQTYARSQIEQLVYKVNQQIVEIRNIRFEWYVSIKTNKKKTLSTFLHCRTHPCGNKGLHRK